MIRAFIIVRLKGDKFYSSGNSLYLSDYKIFIRRRHFAFISTTGDFDWYIF